MALALAADCLAGVELAVACVLALGSVSDRMEKGLSQQSREFMAGTGLCKVLARAAGLD